MDAFLDLAWEYIATGFSLLGTTMFRLLEHLHFLGPLLLVTLLAFLTVALTKFLKTKLVTRRYVELEKEYQHWFGLRQEALKCEDREKGRRLARNIDQAQLNKAYYDYFFEGFLLNLVRKVIPIFFMFAFINEFYRPERMVEMFGREYVLQLPAAGGQPILVGAVFWYVISLLAGYLLWFLLKTVITRKKTKHQPPVHQTAVNGCLAE